MSSKLNVLVTGASGKLGNLIATELLNLQASHPDLHVIAASRTTDKLEALQKKGAEVRHLDLFDPASAEKAFAGVHRLVLVSIDSIGQRFKAHKIAIDAAVKVGVQHVLYTSIPAPISDRPLVDEHFETESYLATKLGYTLLRNHLYHEVLLMSLPNAVKTGAWANATNNGKVAYVSRADLALAAAQATLNFTGTGSDLHRTYDLNANDVVNADQVVELVKEVTGKHVQNVPITQKQLADGLSAFLPPHIAVAIAYLDTHVAEGFTASQTHHLEKLIGRKPKTLKEFLHEQKDALLGGAASH